MSTSGDMSSVPPPENPAVGRAWWQRPQLRTDEEFEQHRAVTWLELFFDLVFVVVLSRLAHDLTGQVDGSGVLTFCLQFAAVFWVWNAFTYYTERFESEGIENRMLMLAALAAVAGLAVWAEGGLDEHYTGFAIAYLAARSVNMIGWIRAARHVAAFRPTAVRFLVGFAVAAALVLVGMSTSGDTRKLLWAVAIVVEIMTPYFTIRQQRLLPRLSTSKFPERFGLFTIIVLGESIVGVIAGLSELNEAGGLSARSAVDGALGLLIGFGLWWVYFDFIARRPYRPSFVSALGWVYLHLVALTMITMIGVGISLAISEAEHGGLTSSTRYLLSGSFAVGLVALGLLETTLHRADDEPTHPQISPALKIGSGAVVGALGVAVEQWTTWALLLMLVVALAVQAAYGSTRWFRQSIGIV